MASFIPITEFLPLAADGMRAIVDARSPAEYSQGHMPGALNIPLLDNEQRAQVGIEFKKRGRERAIDLGFKLAGSSFPELAKKAKDISPHNKEILLYCWRGGLRSQIVSWVLGMYGYELIGLKGGYKTFRNQALEMLEQPLTLVVVGGRTGAGKTEILNHLAAQGHQVIDLEGLANHKGSAFGGLGMPLQPSNEHFENLIASQLMRFDMNKTIYIENESRQLGSNKVPDSLYLKMRDTAVIDVQLPTKRRLARIIEEYGHFPPAMLAEKTRNVEKRMGPQHVKAALELLDAGNIAAWAEAVMNYYDHNYDYGMEQRQPETIIKLECGEESHEEIARKISIMNLKAPKAIGVAGSSQS